MISRGYVGTVLHTYAREPPRIGSVCLLLADFSSPNRFRLFRFLEVCPFPLLPYYTYSIQSQATFVNP